MIFKRKKSSYIFPLIMVLAIIAFITVAIFEPDGGFKFFYLIYGFLALNYGYMAYYNWKNPIIIFHPDQIVFYTFPYPARSRNIEDLTIRYAVGDYIFKEKSGKEYRIIKSNLLKEQESDFERLVESINSKKDQQQI